MYHPHLFARRAELLALRDLTNKLPIRRTISPILEPIKADPQDIRRCMQALGEQQITASIIVNPNEGDFKDGSAVQEWREDLRERFAEFPSLLPAYVCRPKSTIAQVRSFLNAFAGRNTALLYWSPKVSDADLRSLADERTVKFHINLHDQMSAVRRDMLPLDKAVDVKDHFDKCARNADYGGPEFFSDDHLNYRHSSCGFGDYSIVGSRFVAGGGQAHAVAIHGVYRAEGNALWVEHFISDDTDLDVGTVEGKYLQAASKLVDACAFRPDEFGQDAGLLAFTADVTNQTYPGLAASKRRQIYHHLALVHDMLA